jgi:MFS family permease
VLVAARIAQGCGAALMVPQVLSGIQLNLDGPARARALSRYAVALAAGAVLGGVLVSAAGWRPIFLVNVPVGLAVIAAARRVLPADRPRDPAAQLDLPGVATLSGAVALILLPLVLGRRSRSATRDHSPTYIEGAYCAWMPPTRSSARGSGSAERSSSSWRTSSARLSSRRVRTRSAIARPR